MSPSLLDKIVELVVIRGGLAMGIGIGMELMFHTLVLSILSPNTWIAQWLDEPSTTSSIITFIIFHILGWIVVCWDYDRIVADGQPYPNSTLVKFQSDGYEFTGRISFPEKR